MDRVREVLRSEEGTGARALGGVLFGAGLLVLLFRKAALEQEWGDFAVFLTFAIGAAVLYGFGFWGARLTIGTRGWQLAFVVFGLILLNFALFAFVNLVGGDTGAALNVAWIFLVTAIAAFAAALLGEVRVGCLLGALALVVAWLAVWDELLDDGLIGDVGTLRGLLVVAALILLIVAALVALRGRPEGGGSDVVTAAAIAAVTAGAISLGALANVFSPFTVGAAISTNLFWDTELVVASLLALLYGGVTGFRGPAYVGAIGLTGFIYIVGFDADGTPPEGSVVGWPLVLLVVGVGLLVLSVLPALRRPPGTLGPAPAPPAEPPRPAPATPTA